jgi:hypothetical protein
LNHDRGDHDPGKEGSMFHRRQRNEPPSRPFAHDPDCRIVKADPSVEIPWSRLEYGRWRRECVCGAEGWSEPAAERVRQDPLDPSTARHAGRCEFKDTTDRDVLKVLLKVKAGMGEGYSWVTCGACEHEWAVADYAEERVG